MTACNAAAYAQKHECNTHVHDRTMEWFVHSWALLWICAATHRTAFVLSSPSLNIWCVLSTHESIIARIGNITNRSHAALSHCSPSRFPCHFELVWFGSLIYRRRCRLFVFVVLSLAFSWEHTFSANSCSKIEFFCWETRMKKFFYVRSFVYVATFFNFAKDTTDHTNIVPHRNSDRHFFRFGLRKKRITRTNLKLKNFSYFFCSK